MSSISDREMALPAEHADAVVRGATDPQLRKLMREAVSMGAMVAEPEHFQAGYVSGHRHGWLNGVAAGLILGALLTAGVIKLGWWIGGAL
jgi:hypothetical protein